MSTVLYARVPAALKTRADEYAAEQGMTLTRGVVDLIERGLVAATDAPSVAKLEADLVKKQTRIAQLEADVTSARAELGAFTAFAQRAQRAVGRCPNTACGGAISGQDLLGTGTCSRCGQALSSLVVPTSNDSSSLDQREVLMLLGALGAVLAVAYLASK